jgi:hypothetical protein
MRAMPTPDFVTHIAYDGPDLVDGSMDIRALAPALLALGDLLQEANRELNGPDVQLAVHVRSDFKSGSFDVGLGLIQSTDLTALFVPMAGHLATAKQIAEYLGLVKGAGVNLIGLVKWLKGKTPEQKDQRDGHVTLTVAGDNNQINLNVVRLYENPKIRKALADTVRPLEAEGVDRFEARDESGEPVESVTDEDLPAFRALERGLMLSAPPSESDGDTQTLFVEVIKVPFKRNLRFSLSDGQAKFGAVVTDDAFWKRIERRELAFVAGMVMQVRRRFRQHLVEGRLEAEYEIMEVLQVIPPPLQLGLDDIDSLLE